MKKALVFGGSGFIGRYVVEELMSSGYRVANADINRLELAGNYSFYPVNVGDLAQINELFTEFVEYAWFPDVVFNFAGVQDIKECNESPTQAFYANLCGNRSIASVLAGTFDSSVYVYASSLYADSSKSGVYGLTKKHSEEWIKLYHKRYGLPYIILRFGTVYGSRAQDSNSITKLIKESLRTKTISHYGDGQEVRRYIHVKDVAKSCVELVKGHKFSKFLNKTINLIGSNNTSSLELLRILQDILGNDYKTEFRGEKPDDHYKITPYDYEEDLAVNYIPETEIDLGLGLRDLVRELDER